MVTLWFRCPQVTKEMWARFKEPSRIQLLSAHRPTIDRESKRKGSSEGIKSSDPSTAGRSCDSLLTLEGWSRDLSMAPGLVPRCSHHHGNSSAFRVCPLLLEFEAMWFQDCFFLLSFSLAKAKVTGDVRRCSSVMNWCPVCRPWGSSGLASEGLPGTWSLLASGESSIDLLPGFQVESSPS